MSATGSPATLRMVTLSATYGTGGSVIAPRLAERLGLPLADRLIPARGSTDVPTAEESLTNEERDQVRGRRLLDRLVLLAPGMNLPTPDAQDLRDQLRDRVAASIRVLLEQGGAVLVGRAGAIVLADHPGVFHVRLDGPEARRIERASAIESIDAATARDRLHETDSARSRYVQRLYGRDPAEAALYHLVVDATVLPVDAVVELVASAAQAFWRQGA
jgi:cytidylate kinase